VFEGQVEEKKRGISSKQSIFPFLFVKVDIETNHPKKLGSFPLLEVAKM
jgi:hypothetical protein